VRVLGIQGCPRKHANLSSLLAEVLLDAGAGGTETGVGTPGSLHAGSPRWGMLVATAGKSLEIMFAGTKIAFDPLMRSLQGEVFAELLHGGLYEPGSISRDSAAMRDAFEVGRRLALGRESGVSSPAPGRPARAVR
jgi:hypothetical protein